MKNLFLLLFTCLLTSFSCTSEKTTETSANKTMTDAVTNTVAAPMPLSIEIDSLIKKGGPCTSNADCMTVKAVWPILKGGDAKVNTIINDSIANFMIDHISQSPEGRAGSLTKSIDQVLEVYKEAYKENEAFGMGWNQEAIGNIDLSDDVATLEVANYSYMGGAHPNAYTQYANFDLKTGKVIQYADLLAGKDSVAFANIIKQSFLQGVKERVGEDMVMEDFFWGEGFQLAQNFKLEKDSIELLYNPYEAAAYAFGSFSIKVAKSDF